MYMCGVRASVYATQDTSSVCPKSQGMMKQIENLHVSLRLRVHFKEELCALQSRVLELVVPPAVTRAATDV